MKKVLAVVLVVGMLLSVAACGGNVTDGTVGDAGTTEVATEGKSAAETVAVGNKITTDFVEITIEEAAIQNSVKTSIKNGYVTRTFGPDDSSETDFAVIKGKIMNKSTSSVSDEIIAMVQAAGYTLEEDDLYIYKADGDTVWELSPLVEYNFMLCVEVPNALIASAESFDFNFGFNSGLESSFSEYEELEYKYVLNIPNGVAE